MSAAGGGREKKAVLTGSASFSPSSPRSWGCFLRSCPWIRSRAGQPGTWHFAFSPAAGDAVVCGRARAVAFIRGAGEKAGPRAAGPASSGHRLAGCRGARGGVGPGLRQSRSPGKGLEARLADVCGPGFVRTRARRGGLPGLGWDQRPFAASRRWRPSSCGGRLRRGCGPGGGVGAGRSPSPPLPHAGVLLAALGVRVPLAARKSCLFRTRVQLF